VAIDTASEGDDNYEVCVKSGEPWGANLKRLTGPGTVTCGLAAKNTSGTVRRNATATERADRVLNDRNLESLIVVIGGAAPRRDAYNDKVDEEVKAKARVADALMSIDRSEVEREERLTDSLPEGTHSKPARGRQGNTVGVSIYYASQPGQISCKRKPDRVDGPF